MSLSALVRELVARVAARETEMLACLDEARRWAARATRSMSCRPNLLTAEYLISAQTLGAFKRTKS